MGHPFPERLKKHGAQQERTQDGGLSSYQNFQKYNVPTKGHEPSRSRREGVVKA